MKGVISFVVQAVLVIIAVLVFSFFDPFGIMGSKKKKLLDTPITVSSIKEIGKYISAEYYGEVLSSLSEISVTQFDNDSVKNEVRNLHADFRQAMVEIKGKKTGLFRKNRLLTFFHENYSDLINDPHYDTYMEYLKTNLKSESEKEVVWKLSEDGAQFAKVDTVNLSEKLKDVKAHELSVNKKSTKQQIVMLGRGWVKAGFDFGKFTEHNFKYLPEHRAIYLIGMQPEILSCTINPWFIPETGVKGFELILYTGKANNPGLIKKVKQDCLDKLRQAATDQGIIEKARVNAKENLRTFFSLLVEEGIDSVYLVDDSLAVYKNEILLDDIVKGEELSVIDTILARTGKGSFDSASVKVFLDTLMTKKLEMNDSSYKFSCLSSFVYRVISDQAVDSGEYLQMKNLKEQISNAFPNERWFSEQVAVTEETRRKWFESAMDEINKNINQFIINRTDSFYIRNEIISKKAKEKPGGEEKARNDSAMIAIMFTDLKKLKIK